MEYPARIYVIYNSGEAYEFWTTDEDAYTLLQGFVNKEQISTMHLRASNVTSELPNGFRRIAFDVKALASVDVTLSSLEAVEEIEHGHA